MIGIISLFAVFALSLLITRVATVALAATGLGWEAARFQARSAFTGVGFTTSEAEQILNHATRRRIIMWLMLVGHLGLATVVTSLILGFANVEMREGLTRAGWLVAGVLALALVANSRWVDRRLNSVIGACLRRFAPLEDYDVGRLLHLCNGEFAVAELVVPRRSWLDGRTLASAALKQQGVMILGVQRPDGVFLGLPSGADTVHGGDVLVAYGSPSRMEELRRRPAERDETRR